MCVFGFDGFLKFSNPALQKLLGYSDQELCSKTYIEFLHPDDVQESIRGSEAIRKVGFVNNFENRWICKNGDIKIISWNATLAADLELIYAIGRDITELRAKELQISEQKLQIAASSKMNALGRMASGIAHEINNPLTVVYGQSTLLKDMLSEGLVNMGKINSMCDSIQMMCLRIVTVINGLRAFSREGSNDPFVSYSVKSVVDDTLSFCENKIREGGVRLDVEAPASNLIVSCRPSQISQVLLNLLDNAIDAVSPNKSKEITIQIFQDSDESVGLAVVDNGSGIPQEHRDDLFQPFFTTKEVGRGAGLGLSISKGIVDSHNGQIYLDTKSSKTRFVVKLPRT